MTYYMKFDNDGYILDITSYNPNDVEYIANEVTAEIPTSIMRGYYKWNNGFELDADKKAIVDAAYAALPMFPV